MVYRRKGVFGGIGALLLVACASQPLQAPACHPGRLMVLQLEPTVPAASLRRVLHQQEQAHPDAVTADRQKMDPSVSAWWPAALSQAGLQMAGQARAPASMAAQPIGRPVAVQVLGTLQRLYPADVYLRWRVTDYGETPVRWEGAYVGFEVVSTLAIAGAFYAHKLTRPLAGIYLIEEGAEEFSEAYAGFWALNRLSRPVRIEADLVDAHTGTIVWHDQATGMARWRWEHLWQMNDSTQAALLNSSARKATFTIVGDLQHDLARHCAS